MATAPKQPKRQPTGHYALSTDDPRWFPMAQGEMLFQVLAGVINQTPKEFRDAFVQGLIAAMGRVVESWQKPADAGTVVQKVGEPKPAARPARTKRKVA